MNPLVLGPIFELGSALINRLFPDKTEAARAEYEFAKMVQEGSLAVIIKQLEINAKEAQHPSIFVSGWRPFVGWGCGFGLLWSTIGVNIVGWLAVINGWPVPPVIDTELLLYVLGGLLGIAGLRTVEKKSGVASK